MSAEEYDVFEEHYAGHGETREEWEARMAEWEARHPNAILNDALIAEAEAEDRKLRKAQPLGRRIRRRVRELKWLLFNRSDLI
jgi:hypothetical protein